MPFVFASLILAIPPATGLRVPDGFAITEFAGSNFANDITCMTLDPKGRVVVAGRGYIRLLLDDNGDGRADRAIDLVTGVKEHAMGLMWEGNELYAVVDGGLWRWRIRKDGRATSPPERLRALRTSGEHHAHCIRRGPDGWLYLIAGDSAQIDESYATKRTSPIRKPVGGCLVRFSPDFKQSEIVADGFRNPYAFDFDMHGHVWTFDADNERCVSLPWYEGTRVYRVVSGGHHGWRAHQRSETWRCPPYFVDVVPPVADLGRGSPTGVAWHRHTAWPERERGLFLADWTFGKIWRLRPGAKPEPFIAADGESGFAPTALAVHPTSGDLFVSIGGRGTRGAVYRVRSANASARGTTLAPVAEPAPTSPELIRSQWDDDEQLVRSRVAATMAALPSDELAKLRTEARTPAQKVTLALALVSSDRAAAQELAAAALADQRASVAARLHAIRVIQLSLGDLTARQHKADVWAGYTPAEPLPVDRHPRLREVLHAAFPPGDEHLDRELTRTLAVLEDDDPKFIAKLVARLTADSDPTDDVHHLIVLSRLRGTRKPDWTQAIATALLSLDAKIMRLKRQRDNNWPPRIAELHAELARKDQALNDALLNHADFGRPSHALFTRCAGFDRRRAAERFVRAAKQETAFAWDAELVALLGEMPVEVQRPLLRLLVKRGGLDEATLPILAMAPAADDVELFQRGLTAPRLEVVGQSLAALRKLGPPKDGPTALALVRCLRLLPEGKEAERLRQSAATMLETLSGQKLGIDKQRWADWLTRTYPDLAAKFGGADGVDVEGWRKRLSKIDWNAGKTERGRELFSRASCATCHSGSQALGPDLAGAASRFSRDDLFTAILQPSKDVPARYRMTQVESTDGKTYQGLIVYEAVDGLILQTGPAQTVRLAGERIESKRLTEVSLMPTGLLDKLGDGEIADLYAFLKGMGKEGK